MGYLLPDVPRYPLGRREDMSWAEARTLATAVALDSWEG